MDFERVLAMIGEHFEATGEPFGVVGALGVAAHGFGYFRRYGLEALLERLD
ncbi:MAG TPA: hypothetical protein VLB51_04105 [Methylomirabilota bacterium]|nr:hypothetical protein [Methylomirabilota bacterium]